MAVAPINIREHLVPFFFKESEGKEAMYLNKRVKAVLFSPTVSSVGRIIRLLMEKSGQPLKVDNFNMFLTISEAGNRKKYKGEFYKQESGKNSFLKLPPEANGDINDLLEDIFRMSFVSYINGCIENNNEGIVIKAIDNFIDKYDLLEFGYSNDTLRRLYYREKKKNRIISRFQTKKTTVRVNAAV